MIYKTTYEVESKQMIIIMPEVALWLKDITAGKNVKKIRIEIEMEGGLR